jgi:hypothetical protein
MPSPAGITEEWRKYIRYSQPLYLNRYRNTEFSTENLKDTNCKGQE